MRRCVLHKIIVAVGAPVDISSRDQSTHRTGDVSYLSSPFADDSRLWRAMIQHDLRTDSNIFRAANMVTY
jgi:hypothetical protein